MDMFYSCLVADGIVALWHTGNTHTGGGGVDGGGGADVDDASLLRCLYYVISTVVH